MPNLILILISIYEQDAKLKFCSNQILWKISIEFC